MEGTSERDYALNSLFSVPQNPLCNSFLDYVIQERLAKSEHNCPKEKAAQIRTRPASEAKHYALYSYQQPARE